MAWGFEKAINQGPHRLSCNAFRGLNPLSPTPLQGYNCVKNDLELSRGHFERTTSGSVMQTSDWAGASDIALAAGRVVGLLSVEDRVH
jgi:hypothetical protein